MAPSTSSSTFKSAKDLLSTFKSDRVLSEDARTGLLYLLGTAIPSGTSETAPCILKVEKTPYDVNDLPLLTKEDTWDTLKIVRLIL
jgi:m7GpppX diphosphatase